MTVTIQIRNSDDKLTQAEWHDYVAAVKAALISMVRDCHFSGGSESDAKWQNYCFVAEIEQELLPGLKQRLAILKEKYKQNSIAWTEGETEFISNNTKLKLPEWDTVNLRPKTKMPNCPRCGDDELGMLDEGIAFCYHCGLEIRKEQSNENNRQ